MGTLCRPLNVGGEVAPKPLVFFDFDETLTTRDTVWLFVTFLLNQKPYRHTTRIAVCALNALLKLHLVPNHYFKKYLIRLLLREEPEREMASISARFHETYLDSILNRKIFQCLVRHRIQGNDVYLVSSNFDFVLKPLQQKWNLKGIIATQTEISAGRFTGRLLGHTCHGEEKVTRVIAQFGKERVTQAVAYGDSASDLFLLKSVRTGYLIRAGS